MGRVGQPTLLLATFLIAFLSITTLIEGQTRKLVKTDAIPQDSEGIKGPSRTGSSAVDHPFDTEYYLSSGDGFQDLGIAKDGSRVNTENAVIGHGFIPGILGFPWGLGLPLPFPFPFPFPFPPLFPLPGIGLPPPPPGWWGGYGPFPGGPGRFPWGPGGYPGGPGGYPGGPGGYPGGLGRYPGGPGGPGVAKGSVGKGKGEHKD